MREGRSRGHAPVPSPRVQRDMLYRTGLIVPRIRASDYGATDQFAPENLDVFLANLLDGAAPVETAGPGQADIPKADKQCCYANEEIARLILDGKLARKWRLATSVATWLSSSTWTKSEPSFAGPTTAASPRSR
jgi:hypothetical protein